MLDQLPLPIDGPWLFAAVIAGHALVVLALRRLARPDESGPSSARPDGNVVECRRCGTENDPRYRYCRRCVSELPSAVGLGDSDDGVGPAVR